MKLWGLETKEQLLDCVAMVSAVKYGGNLTFNRWPEWNGKALVFTLRVKSSKGPGHRRSISQFSPSRRMVSACWHVHRDVMIEIFHSFPEARLTSSLSNNSIHIGLGYCRTTGVEYNGYNDFMVLYPDTGQFNIGSKVYPVMAEDACDCEDEALTPWEPTLDRILNIRESLDKTGAGGYTYIARE